MPFNKGFSHGIFFVLPCFLLSVPSKMPFLSHPVLLLPIPFCGCVLSRVFCIFLSCPILQPVLPILFCPTSLAWPASSFVFYIMSVLSSDIFILSSTIQNVIGPFHISHLYRTFPFSFLIGCIMLLRCQPVIKTLHFKGLFFSCLGFFNLFSP